MIGGVYPITNTQGTVGGTPVTGGAVANSTDIDYIAPAGVGGAGGTDSSLTGFVGNNAIIVIYSN
jgi:hypothetical protein